MKALYIESDQIKKLANEGELVLSDDVHHHLTRVLRSQIGEKLLCLNGAGLKAYATLRVIDKKKSILQLGSEISEVEDNRNFVVAVGTPKKEYLEDIIKTSVQLGVKKLVFLKTQYSQKAFIGEKRLFTLLASSLIQSNNPYLPEIEFDIPFDDFLKNNKNEKLVTFDLNSWGDEDLSIDGKTIMLIGPEGGFSETEREEIEKYAQSSIKLETPILKATTAVAVGCGYLHALRK